MANSIKQTVTFKVSPQEVYDALMDSKKHAKFTASPAKISQKVGGKFTAYGDYIEGVNLELVPGKKIVQSWRAADWPAGHFSTLKYELKKVPGGTKLALTHSNVPANQLNGIKQGWIDYYWKPMKEMFAAGK